MPLSRRSFLIAASGTVLLGACGGGDGGATADSAETGTTGATSETGPVLVGRFAQGTIVTGIPQRLVYSLYNASDGSAVSRGPDSFAATLALDAATQNVTFTRRQNTDTGPFWTTSTTFAEPGSWILTADLGGPDAADSALSVVGPAANTIPTLGDHLVGVDTPTTTDAHGVDPICTRTPACPLHTITLNDALASGRPTALLIGTPAYCKTGVCGPVLDLLIAEQPRLADKVNLIHAEVYATAYTSDATPVTPAVDAYKLSFEPYLVVAGSDGIIRSRLDVVWDASELRAALDALVA